MVVRSHKLMWVAAKAATSYIVGAKAPTHMIEWFSQNYAALGVLAGNVLMIPVTVADKTCTIGSICSNRFIAAGEDAGAPRAGFNW